MLALPDAHVSRVEGLEEFNYVGKQNLDFLGRLALALLGEEVVQELCEEFRDVVVGVQELVEGLVAALLKVDVRRETVLNLLLDLRLEVKQVLHQFDRLRRRSRLRVLVLHLRRILFVLLVLLLLLVKRLEIFAAFVHDVVL